MTDITPKSTTLREATARAIVRVSTLETIEAIREDRVPKGNVFEMSRAAGLLGVKKTPDLLPDCHPIPIEFTRISYEIKDLDIEILVTVKTIYKTGVEVEAMHGASVVALNMYDMLKPLDKGIEIRNIGLLEKTGGKSQYKKPGRHTIQAAVIVCSDSISAGEKTDRAGKAITEILELHGITTLAYEIIPDETEEIQKQALHFIENDVPLIIFTGGTGLSPRDHTPEALLPLLDRRIPGIEETMRRYGQDRMPYAMLSRSIAGTSGRSLILGLPGSTKGAAESMDAVFPHILHLFPVFRGINHDS